MLKKYDVMFVNGNVSIVKLLLFENSQLQNGNINSYLC